MAAGGDSARVPPGCLCGLRRDGPLQGADDVAEMLGHGRLAGIGIPPGQRRNDGRVLFE